MIEVKGKETKNSWNALLGPGGCSQIETNRISHQVCMLLVRIEI